PCADEDMTPGNIANMSALKGLHAISVCDHNSGANLRACAEAAQEAGILFMPGIELTTAEEVHLLAYFEQVDAAVSFGEFIYAALPDIPNNEEFFGRQLIVNKNDEITGKLDKLLLSALPYSLEECVQLVAQYGGHAVPAHVNRVANSMLSNLGFMPESVFFKTIEAIENLPAAGIDLSRYTVLHSSDAHALHQISEPSNSLIVNNMTIKNILSTLFA
ncbi:MAG: phosphoesterase, partial [Eubacteriales bacterium]